LSRFSRSDRRRSGSAGFTLIEALVALAVVAAVLASIGSVIAVNARGIRAADQRLALAGVASSVLAGLPRRDALRPGTQSGELAGHRWRVDVSPLVAGLVGPSVWVPMAVTVRVQALDGPATQLTTVRLVRRSGG
jgi:general secretion pathway protein I